MDGEVESHELNEFLVVWLSDHVAVVGGPIEGGVGGGEGGVVAVQVVVDLGRDGHQVGDAVHAVLINVLPVGRFVHTGLVGLQDKFNIQWQFLIMILKFLG